MDSWLDGWMLSIIFDHMDWQHTGCPVIVKRLMNILNVVFDLERTNLEANIYIFNLRE